MSVTTADIKNLAQLARIEMTESEMDAIAKDFASILGYVDQINQVALPEIAAKPLMVNATRLDQYPNESGSYGDRMISQAPESQDGFYKVQKIL